MGFLMTDYVVTVAPSGGDFTSLYAAWVYYGLHGTTPASTIIGGPSDSLVITITGDWSGGPDTLTCESYPDRPSNFGSVLIECDAANTFDGVYDDTKYVHNAAIGTYFASFGPRFNCTIKGLQVTAGGGTSNNGGVLLALGSAYTVTCVNCYVYGSQYGAMGGLDGN